MLASALELRYHGYRRESEPAIDDAVRWFEERLERRSDDPEHERIFGASLYAAERWQQASSVFERLEEIMPAEPDVLGHLGLLAARRGDERSAAGYSAELEQVGREDHYSRAKTWVYRARIAAVLGDRSRAVSHLKRAFDEGLGYQPSPGISRQYRLDFESMVDYAPYQELLRPKG